MTYEGDNLGSVRSQATWEQYPSSVLMDRIESRVRLKT